MAKNKLRRFREMKEWLNVYEPKLDPLKREPFLLKGKWNEAHFKNDHPIVLELGCGKGEYAIGMADHFQDKNFIGVDIKGARIWVGAKDAVERGVENVAFLRTKIWLTFSDPQPHKPRKRLTSSLFINRYRKILKKGGIIHLKTDSDVLFESTEEEIKEHGYESLELTWDLYASLEGKTELEREVFSIKTHYEELFTAKGSVIKYCKFRVN